MYIVAILSLWAVLLTPAAAQTIYEVRDESGRVTYADRIPQEASEARQLEVKPYRPSEEEVQRKRAQTAGLLDALENRGDDGRIDLSRLQPPPAAAASPSVEPEPAESE